MWAWPIALLLVGYGEPVATENPNPEERLLLVLTNQVRQAPHDWPGWDTTLATGDARTPLIHEGGLEQAARFHATDMAMSGKFSHDSSDGTPFATRIAQYFQGAAGENIYMATYGGARDGMNAWMNSEGHRTNILNGTWTHLGTGFAAKDMSLYYVQDFGQKNGTSIPLIPAAGIEKGSGGVSLIANFFDPSGREPQKINATLGQKSIALAHIAGAAGNETFSVETTMPQGCEHLTFTAMDGDGSSMTYPSTGALLLGATCTASFASDGSMTGGMGPVVIDADVPHSGCACVTAEKSRGFALVVFAFIALMRLRRARTR